MQVEGSPWASCLPGSAIQVGVIGEIAIAHWQKEFENARMMVLSSLLYVHFLLTTH